MRVLMASKILVVAAYRRKLEELAAEPDIEELLAVTPPAWQEPGGRKLVFESAACNGYELRIEPIRFNGSFHLFHWPGLGRLIAEFKPDLVHMDEEAYNLATLLGMRAVHANVRNLGLSYDQTAPPEPGPDAYDAAEGSLHPVVAEHPESGRPVLYVNSEYTARFEGWTRRESLGLLSYLFGHGQRPEFGVRLRWRPGTIAFWDNRQVWHLAVNDYQGMRRVMSRSMIKGSPPIPAG